MISFLGDSALPSVGESFALRGDTITQKFLFRFVNKDRLCSCAAAADACAKQPSRLYR